MKLLNLIFLLSVAAAHLATAEESKQSNSDANSGSIDSILSVPDLIFLAEAGYPGLEFSLAKRYLGGHGVDQNDELAIGWFLKAANQGMWAAQQTMGTYYFDGFGVTQNFEAAAYWYLEAVRNEDVDPDFFQPASMQSIADNQAQLGSMHLTGSNVPVDYAKALELLTAASQSNHEAMALIGAIYVKGLGVEKDLHEAFKWYHQAAQGGTREFIAEVKRSRDDIAIAAGIKIETKIVPMEGSGFYAVSKGRLIEYDPVLSDFAIYDPVAE